MGDRLVFVSNFINHHQMALCEEWSYLLGKKFHFIETEPMSEERKAMGWSLNGAELPDYVVRGAEEPERAAKLIDEADAVILGAVSDECVRNRIRNGKLVIRYEERPFKEGDGQMLSPRMMRIMLKSHTSLRKKNVYLLCAGAYVAQDMNIYKAYPGKKLSWGYFPRYKDFGPNGPEKSSADQLEILWSGRMIDWKHPELAISAAVLLREKQVDFHITMIGCGELEETVKKSISENNLEAYVTTIPQVSYEEMGDYMLRADLFLMTSDRREGWGAVANESMNRGCVLIANKEAGSIPWLVEDGKTGFTFESEAEMKVKLLMAAAMRKSRREDFAEMQRAAYLTIRKNWNAPLAAVRFLNWLEDPEGYTSPESGVCRRLD